MRGIDSAELARMTASAVESLNDLCNIYNFTGAQDSTTGEVADTYDSGTFNVACGFVETREMRNERGQVISIDADALLRLAASQSISVHDKVIARGKTYHVDGVTPGRNLTICKLLEADV